MNKPPILWPRNRKKERKKERKKPDQSIHSKKIKLDSYRVIELNASVGAEFKTNKTLPVTKFGMGIGFDFYNEDSNFYGRSTLKLNTGTVGNNFFTEEAFAFETPIFMIIAPTTAIDLSIHAGARQTYPEKNSTSPIVHDAIFGGGLSLFFPLPSGKIFGQHGFMSPNIEAQGIYTPATREMHAQVTCGLRYSF